MNVVQQIRELLESFLLTFIIFIYCFDLSISHNEMDVIPYAISLFNENWLETDWYLNLKIPYRYVFSYAIGFFSEYCGIIKTIFFGRILSYFIFSLAYIQLSKNVIKSSLIRILTFILIIRFFQYGIGNVGEWIVGGLETKVFAYSFALLSLASLLNKNYKNLLLYSGAALSFHLLVGGYNLICLLPLIILGQIQNSWTIKEILKKSYLFFITGSLGIYGIISRLLSSESGEISAKGWDIYVNISLPFHLIPNFSDRTWFLLMFFTLLNAIYLFSSNSKKRFLAVYSLATTSILVVGLIVHYFFESHFLRFYFFRFNSVIQPIISLLLISSAISKISLASLFKDLSRYFKFPIIVTLGVSFLIFVFPPELNLDNYIFDEKKILKKTIYDEEMSDWIKNNTPKNSVFITSPGDIYFYINMNRPVFVTWKHLPQNPKDIKEWYDRLKALNQYKDFKTIQEVVSNYSNLNEETLERICLKYQEIDFVIFPSKVKLELPILFESDKGVLYDLKIFKRK